MEKVIQKNEKNEKWCQLFLAKEEKNIYSKKVYDNKVINEKREKKRVKKRRGGFSSSRPLLSSGLMIYTHYVCVCNLSLVDHLRWIMCNQATAAATSKSSSIYAVGK
jgi:hypothetical protein